jgi:hypothetical protein
VPPASLMGRSQRGLHSFLVDRLSQRREAVTFRSSVIFEQVHDPVLALLPETG